MTQRSGLSRDFSEGELTRLLSDYWLVTENSPMNAVIKAVVDSVHHGLKFKFMYPANTTLDIEQTLWTLGLEPGLSYEVVDYDVASGQLPPIGTITIPAWHSRYSDLRLLFPYSLASAKRKFASLVDLDTLRIELPCLPLMHYFLEATMDTPDEITMAFLAAAEDGLIKCTISESFPGSEDFGKAFYRDFRYRRPLALGYLGLSEEDTILTEDNWLNRCSKKVELDEENWQMDADDKRDGIRINRMTFDSEDVYRRHRWPKGSLVKKINHPIYPLQQGSITCAISEIGAIFANLYELESAPLVELRVENTSRERFMMNLYVDLSQEELTMYDSLAPILDCAWQVVTERINRQSEERVELLCDVPLGISFDEFLDRSHLRLQNHSKTYEPETVYQSWEEAQKRLFYKDSQHSSTLPVYGRNGPMQWHPIMQKECVTDLPELAVPPNWFRLDGQIWETGFDGVSAGKFHNQLGFAYIRKLLSAPQQEYTSLALYNEVNPPESSAISEKALEVGSVEISHRIANDIFLSDKKTINAVRDQLGEIEDELQLGDLLLEQRERLEEEKGKLQHYLSQVTNNKQEPRKSETEEVKKKKAIQHAIKRAIQNIASSDSPAAKGLSTHLKAYIRYQGSISYKPSKEFRWDA